MSTRSYRLVVLGCMLSWFLLGLHAPIVHQLTSHQHAPHTSVLAAVAVLALCALAGSWALLRAPGPQTSR